MCSRLDREVTARKSQQYSCLIKICTISSPVDMPEWVGYFHKMKGYRQSVATERGRIAILREWNNRDKRSNLTWSDLNAYTWNNTKWTQWHRHTHTHSNKHTHPRQTLTQNTCEREREFVIIKEKVLSLRGSWTACGRAPEELEQEDGEVEML